eukprot:jgi/Picsp_1/6454/NSC_03801-R1_chloroplast precursor
MNLHLAAGFVSKPLNGANCRSQATSLDVRVRAEEGFCRDKIAFPVERGAVNIEGESTLVFLGAGGNSVEVSGRKDTYMLDSGLDGGLELPFTCRGGICGACVGRVTEGEVDMSDIPDLSFTVTEEEQEKGMTLLCMARPVSDRVVIETQSDWGYSLGVAEWKGATGEINGKKVEPLMGKKWDN